jgi:SAM-dependent methyltransferase
MTDAPIRFDDGAAYERMMGGWSRLAGATFLEWVRPPPGLGWLDVGCGNGAFTELLAERCAPKSIMGVDPSDRQLAYARTRHEAGIATFVEGDAMSLPLSDDSVDAAAMALVIFFVPEPAKGIAEMKRVVRPGGIVATYAWDMTRDGFPWEPIHAALREQGVAVRLPPRIDASTLTSLGSLWKDAGLEQIETREIVVEQQFGNFDTCWQDTVLSPSLKPLIEAMSPADRSRLKARAEALVPRDGAGRPSYRARANAVKGVVPM